MAPYRWRLSLIACSFSSGFSLNMEYTMSDNFLNVHFKMVSIKCPVVNIDDSPQLSHKGKALLEADNELLLSIASLWEIAIKLRLGKLTVAMLVEVLMTQQLTQNDIALLPITVAPLMIVSTL